MTMKEYIEKIDNCTDSYEVEKLRYMAENDEELTDEEFGEVDEYGFDKQWELDEEERRCEEAHTVYTKYDNWTARDYEMARSIL